MSARSNEEREQDPELAAWAEDFRGGDDARPPLSPEAVLDEAGRAARKERLAWASQIAGLAFAIANFLGLVVYTRSLLVTALSAVVLPTLIALFGWFAHLKLSAGKIRVETVARFVRWMVRRSRADLRVLRANLFALAFLLTVFWIWFPLFVLSHADRFGAQPARLVVGATVSLVVFGAGFLRIRALLRRAESELARWKRIEASFEAPSEVAPAARA